MDSLDEMRDWLDRMRERTARNLERTGSTPAGWHVLLPDGEFGFVDVTMPTSAEEHGALIERARGYMQDLAVQACLFVAERELADGRPVLLLQHEAIDRKGKRHRAVEMLRITAGAGGRSVDLASHVEPPAGRDSDLLESGPFPELLPSPPSPLRIL